MTRDEFVDLAELLVKNIRVELTNDPQLGERAYLIPITNMINLLLPKNDLNIDRRQDAVKAIINCLASMYCMVVTKYISPKPLFSLLKDIKEMVRFILTKKGNEYSGDDDRLIHFKEFREMFGYDEDIAAIIWMLKHIVSIKMMVERKVPGIDDILTVNEKFIDAINYCILLYALYEERKGVTIKKSKEENNGS